MSNSLQGRTVVVFGVANKRSIAWAIAQQMQQAGAAAGHHVSERAAEAGSRRTDRGAAEFAGVPVRCLARRGDRRSSSSS